MALLFPLVSYPVAFAAGFLSFFSPCVFPLMPGYLCFMASCSLPTLSQRARPRVSAWPFLPALCFVLGLCTTFVLMGAAASGARHILLENRALFMKVGGAVTIALGAFSLGLLEVPFLEREWRWQPDAPERAERTALALLAGAYLLGLVFGLGWTPCIGPTLGGILLLAANTDSLRQGIGLLAVYSLGLGLPFLFMALFFGAFLKQMTRFGHLVRISQYLSGILLIGLGILLWTDSLQTLASWWS